MTTIAIVGVTGYVGSHVASEALRRGHEVIGVSRSNRAEPQPGMTLRKGNVTDIDLMRELAGQASVLFVATHAVENNEPFLVAIVPSLLQAASEFHSRLGFVGGAGSLLVAPGGPRLIDTPEFPALYKFDAESHAEVLETLRSSGSSADWFYVSPAAGFGSFAPGERTGIFRTGGDLLLTDSDGNSFIGGEDFAIAIIDEIEIPRHQRERFSVAY